MSHENEIITIPQSTLDAVTTLLENLTLENTGWLRYFKRWKISDEPLRNDAASVLSFLRRIEMGRVAREASRAAHKAYYNPNPRCG